MQPENDINHENQRLPSESDAPSHPTKNDPANAKSGTGPAPAAAESLTIPGYTILSEIGHGGMGVVYKAIQSSLGRVVAVKLMLDIKRANETEKVRFQGEAEAAARLRHPNIVEIYNLEAVDGCPYIVMEYCAGGSLAKLLSEVKLLPRQAASLVEQLARGAHAAHQRDIIHRDLKPGNVLLAMPTQRAVTQGTLDEENLPRSLDQLVGVEHLIPKISDFGLAKRPDFDLTATDATLGTPAYIPPEQVGGAKSVDARADVYSLGAILYECLAGRAPFVGTNTLAILQMVHDHDPVSPRLIQPTIPADLDTICMRCLEKAPRRRYANALELAEDLTRFLEGQPIRARPITRWERLWKWTGRNRGVAGMILVGSIAAVLMLFLALLFSAQLGAAKGDLAAEKAERHAQEVIADAEKKSAASARLLASNNKYHSLLNQVRERNQLQPPDWPAQGFADLRQAALHLPTPGLLPELRTAAAACIGGVTLRHNKRIAEHYPAARVVFHPNGRSLILGRQLTSGVYSCSVLVVDVRSGKTAYELSFSGDAVWQVQKTTRDGVRSLGISSDGRWIVAGTRSGKLHRWDMSQKDPKVQTVSAHRTPIQGLAFSRDGKALYSLSEKSLKRWDMEAWKETAMHAGRGPWNGPVTSPCGDWVGCIQNDHFLLLDGGSLQAQRPGQGIGGAEFALSPDGRCLFVENTRTLRMLDLVTLETLATFRQPGQEVAQDEEISGLQVSPDGTLLASVSRAGHRVHLWDVANARLLADLNVGGEHVHMAFSPDGKTLAITEKRGTQLVDIITSPARTTRAIEPRALWDTTWLNGEDTLACLGLGVDRHGRLAGELCFCATHTPKGTHPSIGMFLTPQPFPRCPFAFAPDGRTVHWTGPGGIQSWRAGETQMGQLALERVEAMQCDKDGQLWTGAGVEAALWQVPAGAKLSSWSNELVHRLSGQGDLRSIRVGQQKIVVGIRDGVIALLDRKTVEVATQQQTKVGPVQAIDLNSKETLAFFGSEKGSVGLLDVATGKVLTIRAAHLASVETVAYLRSGLLASGSSDRTVKLWTYHDGMLDEVLTLSFTGPIRRISATADGARLAVLVKGERAVRVWHLDRLRAKLEELGINSKLPQVAAVSRPCDTTAWFAPQPVPDKTRGLRADLYQGEHFERWVGARLDPQVNWTWGPRFPEYTQLPTNDLFSVRWSGKLRPPVPGRYVLALDHHHRARLWLAGKLVLDGDKGNPKSPSEVEVELPAAGAEIRIDYQNTGYAARCRLLWQPQGRGERRVVESEYLRPE